MMAFTEEMLVAVAEVVHAEAMAWFDDADSVHNVDRFTDAVIKALKEEA